MGAKSVSVSASTHTILLRKYIACRVACVCVCFNLAGPEDAMWGPATEQ